MFDIFSLNSFFVRIYDIQIYLNFQYTSVYQNSSIPRPSNCTSSCLIYRWVSLFREVGSRFQHKCQS